MRSLIAFTIAMLAAWMTLVASPVQAQSTFDLRTSLCGALEKDAERQDEVMLVTDAYYRTASVAEKAKFRADRRRVLDLLLARLEATPPSGLRKFWNDVNEHEGPSFGNSSESSRMAQYVMCLIEEKELMSVDQTQSVGPVSIRLKYSPGDCFSVTVTNNTGKFIDAFVRLGINNENSELGDRLTGWAGTPTVVISAAPGGYGALFPAQQHFENLAATSPGNARTLPFRSAISVMEPDRMQLQEQSPLPMICRGIKVWLPASALKWEENVVQRLALSQAADAARRKAEGIAGIERNEAQRAQMDAKTKAFLASPRGSVLCKWYKKSEDQYSCMRRACATKAYQDEPACSMLD